MKIYTGQGDLGKSRLFDDQMQMKSSPVFEFLGDLDELNSLLGVVISKSEIDQAISYCLQSIQHILFHLGAEVANESSEGQPLGNEQIISNLHSLRLEQYIDQWSLELPSLSDFILPGGCAAYLHQARAVARRVERRYAALIEIEGYEHLTEAMSAKIKFLNRLSDLLFIAARKQQLKGQVSEVTWDKSVVKKFIV